MKLNLSSLSIATLTAALSFPAAAALNTVAPPVTETKVLSSEKKRPASKISHEMWHEMWHEM